MDILLVQFVIFGIIPHVVLVMLEALKEERLIKADSPHNILTFSVISDGHPPQHDD